MFYRELTALYAALSSGRPSPLPPLPIQYADYAAWQRDFLQGETLETQRAYWRRALAGAPLALDLPTDRPRPAVRTHQFDTQDNSTHGCPFPPPHRHVIDQPKQERLRAGDNHHKNEQQRIQDRGTGAQPESGAGQGNEVRRRGPG